MPRNSTGTYSLPQSSYVDGQTITAEIINSNFSDIANELTNSLAANGVTTMTGQIKASAGSVAAPGIAFGTSTGTGLYLAGTNQIGIATNGTQLATLNSDQSVSLAGAFTAAGASTFNGAVTHASTTTLTGAVTLNATTYTFGAGAVAGFYTALAPAASIGQIIDGAGSVVTTGQRGQIYIPFPMTITNWWVMADQSGSVTIDVLRANNAVPSSSIVGAGTKPNLSSSQFTTSAPSSWTSTTLAANDFIAFSITGSPSSVTRVSIYLSGLRTG